MASAHEEGGPERAVAAGASAVRVVHLRNSDRFGGPERLLVEGARGAGPGVRTTLASFGPATGPHPFLDAAAAAGIATERIEQSGSYDARIVSRVRDLVARTAADVVVGHDYKANLVLAAAGRGRGWTRAAVVHGYTAEDRKVRWFEAVDRRLLRRAQAVVAVSNALEDDLIAAGVPPERVHRIENGIDVAGVRREAQASRERVRREWGVPEGERVVLALGRWSPEKGHATLVAAFTQADLPSTRLVLVGSGPCEAELRAQAAPLGARVAFAGWRSDPWACLGAADLFVLPSLREGLPLAVLEAMAAGVPVVASAVGGVPEALDQGRCGTLVPPSDVSALSRVMTETLGNVVEARERAGAARSRVAAKYGSARQASALSNLWMSLHLGAIARR